MAKKTYLEAAAELPIYDECDVLVVGAGSAGHSAAIAAARAGCEKVILMERFGYFGGDVTGGYVLAIPGLSWRNFLCVRGLQEEWFARLDKNAPDSYIAPEREELGEKDPFKLERWSLIHGNVSHDKDDKYLVRCPYYEPTALKLELDAMVEEEPNIKVMIHCWGTKPIMDGDTIKGVIFESKEGRQAVLAKVVIDATGDGDIYRQSGASFFRGAPKVEVYQGGQDRGSATALVWRMGGVDYEGYARWAKANPEAAKAFNAECTKIAGYRTGFFPAGVNDVVWWNNWLINRDCADLEDIRYTEFTVRDSIRRITEFCRKNMPYGRNAFIYDIAPQLGSRCSYRLDGEHIYSRLDIATAAKFDDVIAWHSAGGMLNGSAPIEIPYSTLLPKKIENLLCPGRHFSVDAQTVASMTLIPQCVGTGQGAGVAAAVAVKDGTTTHNVDIKKVQKILCEEQDVPLPRQENTDPELVRALEDCKYGIYNDAAKKVREAAGLDW